MSRETHVLAPRQASGWRGKILVVTTVVVSGCALYGFSLASDPETYQADAPVCTVSLPCEDDYRRVADTSHNERIFGLRQLLAERGFLLNGTQEISANPLAVLRGTYGLVSPDDDRHACEWRLMATRSATCRPCSHLRLGQTVAFSPELAGALAREWRQGESCLPAGLIRSGETLLDRLVATWEEDRTAADGERALAGDVVERCWTRHKQARKYDLRLRQIVGEYELEAQVCDRRQADAASCEVALVFKWLGHVPQQLTQRD